MRIPRAEAESSSLRGGRDSRSSRRPSPRHGGSRRHHPRCQRSHRPLHWPRDAGAIAKTPGQRPALRPNRKSIPTGFHLTSVKLRPLFPLRTKLPRGSPGGSPGEKIACRAMPVCSAISSPAKSLPDKLSGSSCRLVPGCAAPCRIVPKTPFSLWGSSGREFKSRRPDHLQTRPGDSLGR